MDDIKQRNKDHIKNKRKYKPKSVKDPKHIPHKSTINLESNWDRYENENVDQKFQLTSNTDFSILASAPITKGHHFQFKSDKFIAEEIESKIATELFSLNLNMLRDSVLTVPFYERIGIDSNYFTENQLKFMNRDADINLAKFKEKYDNNVIEESLRNPSGDKKEDQCIVNNDSPTKEEESELSSDPALPEVRISYGSQENASENLEQWLDDILDD